MTPKAVPDRPPFLLLGQILRPQGVRGEVRVEVLTDYPERIVAGVQVYVGRDPDNGSTAVPYQVASARTHQRYLLLRFEGIEDREAAELLRDRFVMIPLDEAVPLEEGEFYLYQAIGLDVFTVDGEPLGRVSEVLETGANDVYVVQGPRGEILIPAIEDVIVDIDIEAGKMTVQLMEGL